MPLRYVVDRSPGRVLVTWPNFVRVMGMLFLVGGIALVTLAVTQLRGKGGPFWLCLLIGLAFIPVGYAMCCNVFRLEMSARDPRYALRRGVFPFTQHHAGPRADAHIEIARGTRTVGSSKKRRRIEVVEAVIVLPDPPQQRVEIAVAVVHPADAGQAYQRAQAHAKEMSSSLQIPVIDRARTDR